MCQIGEGISCWEGIDGKGKGKTTTFFKQRFKNDVDSTFLTVFKRNWIDHRSIDGDSRYLVLVGFFPPANPQNNYIISLAKIAATCFKSQVGTDNYLNIESVLFSSDQKDVMKNLSASSVFTRRSCMTPTTFALNTTICIFDKNNREDIVNRRVALVEKRKATTSTDFGVCQDKIQSKVIDLVPTFGNRDFVPCTVDELNSMYEDPEGDDTIAMMAASVASTQVGQRAPPAAAFSLSSLITSVKSSKNEEVLFSRALRNSLGTIPGFHDELLEISNCRNRKLTNTSQFCDIIARNAYLGVKELKGLMVPIYSKGNTPKIVAFNRHEEWKSNFKGFNLKGVFTSTEWQTTTKVRLYYFIFYSIIDCSEKRIILF